MLSNVTRALVRTGTAVAVLALGLLVSAADATQPADVLVDMSRAAAGPVTEVAFEFGSNELHDIFVADGIDRARESGLDSVRVWLGHRFLTAAVHGTNAFDLDWEQLHHYVARVLAAGATPHVSFVAPPAWIPAADGRPSSHHESETLGPMGAQAYGEYVAEAIGQLHARFGEPALDWRYVIWNEPNNHQNAGRTYACGSGEAYAVLFNEARAATDRRFGPGRIALGGPSLDAIDTGATLNAGGQPVCGAQPDLDWRAYLASVDARVPFDFITWHWYGMFEIGRASPHETLTNRLQWFERRVALITELAAGRPHFVEEINYNGDLAADPLIDTQVNAAFLASATLRSVRQGASGIMVYKGTRGPGGLAPRGEPDFGLWSSAPDVPPTPAYRALQLLRRVIVDGGRLAHVEVRPSDVDALALVRGEDAALVLVNLSDQARDVRIAGLPAGPAIHTDDVAQWRTDWFDGETLMLRAHAVAVISPAAAGLATMPVVAEGAAAYSAAAATLSCAACHGVDGQDGPAPAIRGVASATFDAAHAANVPNADAIAAFLAGLAASTHTFGGQVTDEAGIPIEGAMVLADFGAFGRAALSDAEGQFWLSAALGDAGPLAVVPTLSAVHPDFRAADRPTTRTARSLNHTDVVFELASAPSGAERPLLASAHVVPHTGQGIPAGVWTVGVATAGDDLSVWAVHRASGRAVRLQRVDQHSYGLFRARIGALDPPANERHWTFVAVAPDGAASRFNDFREALPAVGWLGPSSGLSVSV